MKASERRLVFGVALSAAALTMGWAYYASLVPATHPDHDHGILNLDAGGRLLVETREGTERNLVGRPGHVLVVHFFGTAAPEAAEELREVFALQKKLKSDTGVEFVLIARDTDFVSLDSWMKKNSLEPPLPGTLVVDPAGETTTKLNCKRPLETMFFNAEGKLSSQARGRLQGADAVLAQIDRARGGATIE